MVYPVHVGGYYEKPQMPVGQLTTDYTAILIPVLLISSTRLVLRSERHRFDTVVNPAPERHNLTPVLEAVSGEDIGN